MLALLLSHFVIELSDKPVVWNISGIRFPTVGIDGAKPELPLKVSLYNPAAAASGAARGVGVPVWTALLGAVGVLAGAGMLL